MARDIGEWLDGLGLGRYAEAFSDNEIDLQALPHITEEDLKEIGVALGARRKLLAAIAELGGSDAPATADERWGRTASTCSFGTSVTPGDSRARLRPFFSDATADRP